MNIVHLAFEASPFCKYGGIGESMLKIPFMLQDMGTHNFVILPFHRGFMQAHPYTTVARFQLKYRGAETEVEIKTATQNDIVYYFIDCQEVFEREGIYHRLDGTAFPDHVQRSLLFSQVSARIIREWIRGSGAIIYHDWYGSPLSLLEEPFKADYKQCFIIHNFHYHGYIGSREQDEIEEPFRTLISQHLRQGFYPSVGCMSLPRCDLILVVSEQYKAELLSGHIPGHSGLEVFKSLPQERIKSFLQGIDYERWVLPFRDFKDLSKQKQLIKESVCKRMKLDAEKPLLYFGARLILEKGIDYFIGKDRSSREERIASWAGILDKAQLVIIGNPCGDSDSILKSFIAFQNEYPHSVRFIPEYRDNLAIDVMRGSDIFLMPSSSEPCGLAQMHAMANGTVPLANRVGGLVDTIVDYEASPATGTGFFSDGSYDNFLEKVETVLTVKQNASVWSTIMQNAAHGDYTWDQSIKRLIQYLRSV